MKEINMKPILKARANADEANRREINAHYYNLPTTYLTTAREDAVKAYEKACEKLNAAIKEAEGRATSRTICVKDIIDELAFVENTLGLPKKLLEGVRAYIDPNAQDFPKAYKWTPESTTFYAEFRGGSWRITKIYRGTCHSHGRGHQLELTDAARAALIEKIRVF